MPSDCFASAVPNTYVVVIVWAAGRRLADLLRLVDEGRRVVDSSTRGATDDSEPIGIDPRLSSALSTLALGHAKLGTDANTFCFASVVGSAVWTSLLCIKEVMPEVYVNGAAEAVRGGGKIGPVATGEVVDAGGREAVDGPALLDGNPLAVVDPDVVPGVANSMIFFWRCTVVQGSWSSDHGSGSSPLLPKYLAPEITGVETGLWANGFRHACHRQCGGRQPPQTRAEQQDVQIDVQEAPGRRLPR